MTTTLTTPRALAAAAGLFALAAAASGSAMDLPGWVGLSATGLLLAAALVLVGSRSAFLTIFLTIFAVEFVVFGAAALAAAAGWWPQALAAAAPPASLAVTAGVFGVLVVAVGRIPVIRTIMGVADRYFARPAGAESAAEWRERALAIAAIVFLVVVNQAQVGMAVRLSFFNRDFIDSIQQKNQPEFWNQLLWVFLPWAMLYVLSNVAETLTSQNLLIRWRRWLTHGYIAGWLGGGTHYRLPLSKAPADNPDQRIAEDVRQFTESTYNYSITLLSQVSSLVSFSLVLWAISPVVTLPLVGVPLPGTLFWVAVLYAVIGTLLTHLIGRALIPLYFERQHVEADFRFGLSRLREYGEQVALLGGEPTEQRSLGERFRHIVRNFYRILFWKTGLQAFTSLYGRFSAITPWVVAAPFYFAGQVTFGVLSQTAQAFAQVEGSLAFFIDRYAMIADYKAVIDRLTTFDAAIAQAQALGETRGLTLAEAEGDDLQLKGLTVALPDGRVLVRADETRFEGGQATLLTGPSGSGKSTLFRAVAGIWPFAKGVIATPRGRSMLLLPQRPYIPIGSLRAAVSYPAAETVYADAAIAEALRAARLPHLVDRLDTEAAWAQTLSLGEQQRLAVARALLAKPDWLFLDEATAALDEPTEAAIYKVLRERLPDTTLVSIGHRSTLHAFHDRRIEMRPGEGGLFNPVAARLSEAAE